MSILSLRGVLSCKASSDAGGVKPWVSQTGFEIPVTPQPHSPRRTGLMYWGPSRHQGVGSLGLGESSAFSGRQGGWGALGWGGAQSSPSGASSGLASVSGWTGHQGREEMCERDSGLKRRSKKPAPAGDGLYPSRCAPSSPAPGLAWPGAGLGWWSLGLGREP